MTERALTSEQSLAVSWRESSVFLSSGAGCGKTTVLTERYLAHLREGAEISQLVAITFTERAAREMRQRIRAAILHHLRTAPDEDEAESWARHLRGLETAAISTIHAFCAAILRQHSLVAGLDPAFDVLEEVLTSNLSVEVVSETLRKLLTAQSDTGEDLRQLIILFGWPAVLDAVSQLSSTADRSAWQQWLAKPDEEIAANWEDYARTELKPRWIDFLFQSRPAMAEILPLLRENPPLDGPLSKPVQILLDELPKLATAPDFADAVERLREAAMVRHHGKKAWPDRPIYEQIRDTFKSFRAEMDELSKAAFAFDPAEALDAIAVGKRFLRVTLEVVRACDESKRLHGVLDFDDLIVLARDLLRDRADVRARLQERYRFLLLDELQDTDPLQMEVIDLLGDTARREGKLFVVGDHSQSIYRFRGADVSQFLALRERIDEPGRQELTLNFRSQKDILDFANVLLRPRLTAYRDLEANRPQLNPQPCIEWLWTEGSADNATRCRMREAEALASRIAGMLHGEQLVVEKDRLREVQASDIILLFRSMTSVHLYEKALRDWGIDYYLVGGRAFFAQQEICDILHLLRALENPHDEVALAGLLRSPFCCLSDEAIYVLRWSEESRNAIWDGLHDDGRVERLPADQRPRVQRARRFLDRWRGLKDTLPIARLLGEVLADSGYDASLYRESLGERKLANLWKLLDLARTFDRSGLFGLPEFIARLGDLVERQPREEQAATQPEKANVVRLMTIHQAKGLEFPVVILPDLNFRPGTGRERTARWDPFLGCVTQSPTDEDPPLFADHGWKLWRKREELEQWHESMRLLYVACTRAEDYLLLSASLPATWRVESPWMQLLAERYDLRTGVCKVDGSPCIKVSGSLIGAAPQAEPLPPRPRETVGEVDPQRIAVISAPLSNVAFNAEDYSDLHTWLPT